MDNTSELLNQLRDIHLPTPISNWPWATGRYVVIGLLVIMLIMSAIFIWQCWQRQQGQKKILKQLLTLQVERNFAGLSVLLKQIALRAYPQEAVASLHNLEWLAFLDRTNVKHAAGKFQSPVGKLLLDLPYRKSVEAIDEKQQENLFKLVKNWLLKNYKGKHVGLFSALRKSTTRVSQHIR